MWKYAYSHENWKSDDRSHRPPKCIINIGIQTIFYFVIIASAKLVIPVKDSLLMNTYYFFFRVSSQNIYKKKFTKLFGNKIWAVEDSIFIYMRNNWQIFKFT